MTLPSRHTDPILRITLTLAEYPILCDKIRAKMRKELFRLRFITPQDFEALVREQSIRSQRREGLHDPYGEESTDMWDLRQERVRSHLTDFYFAANLPYELFEQIVLNVVKPSDADEETTATFNPELAPKYMLFEQARQIERKPPSERAHYEPLLQEIKVVLIRTMISDQLAYVRIAKEWLTIDVLENIWRNKIGYGRIGGKSAGMLLAYSILLQEADEDVKVSIRIPDSYFLGSDLMYSFMTMNGLLHWNDQKYKSEEKIRADYPTICEEYLRGEFPADILDRLADMLYNIGNQPIIVRSSSQLEDNFGFSFAGKYDSYFCPNQGTPEENLEALTEAIARIYASTVNPEALLYRRSKGLQDYDERMAILIQVVEGEPMAEDYFLPHGAGVAFSRNLYRWSPNIRREDGFMRLVWGLGTRAVDAVGNDYPRLVALGQPTLRPDNSPQAIRHYSQQYVDLIDLKENLFKTLPVKQVLTPGYKPLRQIAQIYRDGFVSSIRSTVLSEDMERLILTFDTLLRQTPFPDRMRRLLQTLESHYKMPVDLEFTIRIENSHTKPEVQVTIVQCRPQSQMQESEVHIPNQVNEADILIATHRMVPRGYVENIQYVLFVPASTYFALNTQRDRQNIARIIGRLNQALENHTFICMGPGRWGTTNTELGVSVGYADIYHARALIEMTGKTIGSSPEPSFGTHFFQDLMESNTYPLVVSLDDSDVIFKESFFFDTPNCIAEFLSPEFLQSSPYAADCIRLIDVRAFRPGFHLNLIMDDDKSKAIALLIPDS